MNRTCVRQIVVVCAARSALATAGASDVSHGTATPQAMTRPSSIAIPTESPTSWPTPNSASDQAML